MKKISKNYMTLFIDSDNDDGNRNRTLSCTYTEQVSVAVIFYTFIRQIPGSNRCRVTAVGSVVYRDFLQCVQGNARRVS